MIPSTTKFWDKYDGDGIVTDFPITTAIKYYDPTLINVRILDDDGTITEDSALTYTVDLVLKQVEFSVAPTATETIYILPDVPVTQMLDLVNGDPMDADNMEGGYDKLTALAAQILYELERALKYELPDDEDALIIPNEVDRANKWLYFDGTGALTVAALASNDVTITAFMETILALSTAADVRTALDLYSTVEADATEADLGGAGRTTETIKGNADDIVSLEGAGRTTETVKDNSDDIATNATGIAALQTEVATDVVRAELVQKRQIGGFERSGTLETFLGAGSGSLAALTTTRVAVLDCTLHTLETYDFSGSAWSQVGNSLVIGAAAFPYASICTMSATTIAFADEVNDELRQYSFDGTDWSLVGNGLAITGLAAPYDITLAGLSSTTIAFIDQNNDKLRKYSFDGTDWTLTGSELALTIGGQSLTALSENMVALFEYTNDALRAYRFNGTTWVAVGSAYSTANFTRTTMAAISHDTVILAADSATIQALRFNGTVWIPASPIIDISSYFTLAIAAMDHDLLAFWHGASANIYLSAMNILFDAAPVGPVFG